MEQPNTKLYLYAVTYAQKKPIFPGKQSGIEGKKVYLINTDTLSAVVTPVTEDELMVSRKHVMNHQDVIEEVRQQYGTVVPISFGTVVKDEKALKSQLLFEKEEHLLHTLDSLKGKVQFNVKALWPDLEQTIKNISQHDPELVSLQTGGQSTQVSMDVAVKVGKLVEQSLTKERTRIKQQIISAMNSVCDQHKALSEYGEEMIANLVFLCEAKQEKKVTQTLEKVAKQLQSEDLLVRHGAALTPYDFVSMRLSVDK